MSTLSTNARARLSFTELRCIGSWSEHTNPEYYSAHTVLPTPYNGLACPHQGHGRIVLREREKQEALSHKEDFAKRLEPAHREHRQCDDLIELYGSGAGANCPACSKLSNRLPSKSRTTIVTEQSHSTTGFWQPYDWIHPHVGLHQQCSQSTALESSLEKTRVKTRPKRRSSASLKVNYDNDEEKSLDLEMPTH